MGVSRCLSSQMLSMSPGNTVSRPQGPSFPSRSESRTRVGRRVRAVGGERGRSRVVHKSNVRFSEVSSVSLVIEAATVI